jgi:hypothetical protein
MASQVLTAIRGARVEGHITGKIVAPNVEIDVKKGDIVCKEPNLEYEEWFARDQQVLGFIFTSVSKEVLGQIVASTTAVEARAGVANIFCKRAPCARHYKEGRDDHHRVRHQDAGARR